MMRKAIVPYTPEELLDQEIADLRVEYASTIERMGLVEETRKLAHAVATKLGHTAMRQGNAYECPKCGLSGAARRMLDGGIFIVPCGTKYEPGAETTLEEHAARCRYEFSRAREVEAAGPRPGMAALAESHRECARDYGERVIALKNAASPRAHRTDECMTAGIGLGDADIRIRVSRLAHGGIRVGISTRTSAGSWCMDGLSVDDDRQLALVADAIKAFQESKS